MNDKLTPAVKKCMNRLLPFLILLYTLAFLDRANVGFAKQAYQADTGLSNAAFAFGAGIFFAGYSLLEVPSNIVMHKVGAKAWICRIMVTWGLVAAAMMYATTPAVFYALRFLLGVTEAGLFPGVILYLTYWFPEHARGRATGLFYFGVPVALVIGGPLSGLLLELDGIASLKGWQWMFMVEGLLASVVGVWAYFRLDNGPRDATWLTEEEKAVILESLEREERDKKGSGHAAAGILRGMTSPRTLYLMAVFFFVQIAAYGLIFYMPTIVAGYLGEKVGVRVGLASAIPWAVSLVGIVYLTRWSDRTGIRHGAIAVCYLLLSAALIAAAYLGTVPGIVALCLAATAYCAATPLFWIVCSQNLQASAAPAGIALIGAVGNLGGFLAPILKTWVESQWGPGSGLITLAGTAAVSALLVAAMRRPMPDPHKPYAVAAEPAPR